MAADAAAVGIEDAVNLEVGPRINEYALFVVGIVKSIGQEACLVSKPMSILILILTGYCFVLKVPFLDAFSHLTIRTYSDSRACYVNTELLAS